MASPLPKFLVTPRILHFNFKVGNRPKFKQFLTEKLDMQVLRHEDFESGCPVKCNGAYDGRWSKTIIGYGGEHSHFVIEMIYNLGVDSYEHGNDFKGITIKSHKLAEQMSGEPSPICEEGYAFHIINEDKEGDQMVKVSLAVTDIDRSYEYWVGLLGMKVYEKTEDKLLLAYADDQVQLELVEVDQVTHGNAYGRIAFACAGSQLAVLEEVMKETRNTIIHGPRSLATEEKPSVDVIILADPDGHEICFVGDEEFRKLSVEDERPNEKFNAALALYDPDTYGTCKL